MGRLKETRGATADVVWSKGMGTSAFDLMCGPIKTHSTGAISVFLSVSVCCWICPSLALLLTHSFTHDSKSHRLHRTAQYFVITFLFFCAVNVNTGPYILSRRERAGVVKSLICTSRNSHKSPVPLHPRSPPPTQFPGQQSSQYEARLVYCDSIWLSTQGVGRHSFLIHFQ